jgi:hypothetical protein
MQSARNVPEEHTASFFRVEEQIKKQQQDSGGKKEYLPDYTASHPRRWYSAVPL